MRLCVFSCVFGVLFRVCLHVFVYVRCCSNDIVDSSCDYVILVFVRALVLPLLLLYMFASDEFLILVYRYASKFTNHVMKHRYDVTVLSLLTQFSY